MARLLAPAAAGVATLVLLLFGPSASASADPATEGASAAERTAPSTSRAPPWLAPQVLGSGHEIGVETRFLQFGGGAVGPAIGLPELMLLKLGGRFAWGERTDFLASLTLLPLQPHSTKLWVWQSANLSLRRQLSDAWAAEFNLDAGPQVPRLGHWGAITASATTRRPVTDFLVLEGTAGADLLHLPYDDGNTAHIGELRAGADAHLELGALIFKAGFLVAAPVFSFGSMGNGLGAPAPKLFSDLHAGLSLAVSEQWAPYLEVKAIRRGDLAAPRTTVPILDGGFDQQQVVIGVVHRSGSGS